MWLGLTHFESSLSSHAYIVFIYFSVLVFSLNCTKRGNVFEFPKPRTIRNKPSKNGNVGGNAVYKKIKFQAIYIYIYIYIYSLKKKSIILQEKHYDTHK
jgi:hypothetical protein